MSFYLSQLLKHLDDCLYDVPKIFEDDQGTIALAKNPVSTQRCKHIDIKYHFVRSTVNDCKVLGYSQLSAVGFHVCFLLLYDLWLSIMCDQVGVLIDN